MLQLRAYLDKRPYDNRLYDVVCSNLLDPDDVIIGTPTAVIENDYVLNPVGPVMSGLVLGACIVNQAPIRYPLLQLTVPIGQVIQLPISGGVLLPGYPEYLFVLAFRFATLLNPAIEATVQLRLTPGP